MVEGGDVKKLGDVGDKADAPSIGTILLINIYVSTLILF